MKSGRVWMALWVTCLLAGVAVAEEIENSHLAVIREMLAEKDNIARLGTASSPDGLDDDGGSRGDQAAVDGNPETYWDEANDGGLYRWVLTLPKPYRVHGLAVAGYAQHDYAPKDFEVLLDGKPAGQVKDAAYKKNIVRVKLPPTVARRVELRITAWYGQSPAIREVGVFGQPAPAPPPAKPAKWEWKQEADSLALIGAGGLVWKWNLGKDLPKVFFDPLGTADGRSLTWNRPPDHAWHHGLWFSWKLINALNYWEFDRATGKPPGTTKLVKVDVVRTDADGATVKLTFAYHPAGKPADVQMDETVTAVIQTPRPDGTYRIDWLQDTTARQDVVLDRTPPPGQPGGVGHGGYGGFSFRGAKELRGVFLLNSAAQVEGATHRARARWLDASGRLGKRYAGVTIFDHPSNARHPTPWFIVDNRLKHGPFTYTNPAILCWKPLTLKKGVTLRQFYRVLVHEGPGYAGDLDAEFKRFADKEPAIPIQGEKLYVEPVLPPPGASDWSATHVNVATPKLGAKAWASSVYGEGYGPENVMDGRWEARETDKWNSAANITPHFVTIDLGEVRTIDRIRIVHEGLTPAGKTATTADFRLQSAPRRWGPWKDLVPPVRDNAKAVTEHLFKPVGTRYIRLLIETGEQAGKNTYGRLFEIQVFAPKKDAQSPARENN